MADTAWVRAPKIVAAGCLALCTFVMWTGLRTGDQRLVLFGGFLIILAVIMIVATTPKRE